MPWVLNYNSQIELWKVLSDKERKDATIYVIQPGAGGDGNSPSVVPLLTGLLSALVLLDVFSPLSILSSDTHI